MNHYMKHGQQNIKFFLLSKVGYMFRLNALICHHEAHIRSLWEENNYKFKVQIKIGTETSSYFPILKFFQVFKPTCYVKTNTS